MILKALSDYYEKLDQDGKVPAYGYAVTPVRYALNLDDNGKILSIEPCFEKEITGKPGKEKEIIRPAKFITPILPARSSGKKPGFLADNSRYILGMDILKDSVVPAPDYFQTAKELHLEILKNASSPGLIAVYRFFENWNPEARENVGKITAHLSELQEKSNYVFCYKGRFVHELPEAKELWNAYYAQPGNNDQVGLCLVTGKEQVISRTHNVIKGIKGAQSKGASLVSFNAKAFESYCWVQSYNSPVSKRADFNYTSALNYLISLPEGHTELQDTMVVYWAQNAQKEYQDLFQLMGDPAEEDGKLIHDIFQKLSGLKGIDLNGVELDPDEEFYILGLTPNVGRLSLRFFLNGTFGTFLSNLKAHYDRTEIVRPVFAANSFLGFGSILNALTNPKSRDKKVSAEILETLSFAILNNFDYPGSMLSNLLMRIRAEAGNVTWQRAALIKAYLLKNKHYTEEELPVALNENSQSVAYNLGRLFAILEYLQIQANDTDKSTIRSKYFNSCAANPASVFPTILKLGSSHLNKLESRHYIWFDKQITDMMNKIPDHLPKTLSMEEQGEFMLGYYHQHQYYYTPKKDTKSDENNEKGELNYD